MAAGGCRDGGGGLALWWPVDGVVVRVFVVGRVGIQMPMTAAVPPSMPMTIIMAAIE